MIRPIEFWKPVTNEMIYNIRDGYWISSEGRVYSQITNRFIIPHIIKGYWTVGLYTKNGIQITRYVHRLVAIAFCYNPNYRSLQIDHINGDKLDCNETNLEFVTPRENVLRAHRNGLCKDTSGENNSMASITNEEADYIGSLLASGNLSTFEISKITGYSNCIINTIKNGYGWKFVYEKYKLYDVDIPRYHEVFSKEQIKFICKYLEDHKGIKLTKYMKYEILNQLGLEVTEDKMRTIGRIYRKERFKSISSDYDF